VDCARAAVNDNADRTSAAIPNCVKILQYCFIITTTSENERPRRTPSLQKRFEDGEIDVLDLFSIGSEGCLSCIGALVHPRGNGNAVPVQSDWRSKFGITTRK